MCRSRLFPGHRLGRLFLFALLVLTPSTFAFEDDFPIRVKFGEPNIWSLDQAHYLLEQRFQKNQTLEATRPGPDELNANATNGTRMSALRQMFQASVGFDQSVGLTNQLAQGRISEDLALRPFRQRALEESFRKQAETASRIQAIADDPASYVTKPDNTKELSAEAKAKTAALNIQLDTEKRVGDSYKAMLTDSVPTALKPTESPEAAKALSGATLEVFKDKFAFGDPRLSASNAVDNFVNLQNEMIMKQVTLLRNEAGYNRRIIFAELPQAFEVDGSRWYAKRAENKLVQVQWQLAGYLYVPRDNLEDLRKEDPNAELIQAYLRRTILDVCKESYCKDAASSDQNLSKLSETEREMTDRWNDLITKIEESQRELVKASEKLKTHEQICRAKNAVAAPIRKKLEDSLQRARDERDEVARKITQATQSSQKRGLKNELILANQKIGIAEKGLADFEANPDAIASKEACTVYAKSSADKTEKYETLSTLNSKLPKLRDALTDIQKRRKATKEFIETSTSRAYPNDKNAKLALALLREKTWFAWIDPTGKSSASHQSSSREITVPQGTLRTVDLVPRVSSLNVNTRNYASTYFGISGFFRFLSGLGVSASYQRQKETYDQYINQEIFASSYGKGSSSFGWTFGPNPGSDVIAPGQRNTFAIFSVPANALAILLKSRSCVYDRRDRVPREDAKTDPSDSTEVSPFKDLITTDKQHCSAWSDFPLVVPGEFDSGFWIKEVRYSPVASGNRLVAYLYGSHFSTLTGVTVDGVPLRRSVSVASQFSSDSTLGSNTSPSGEYEHLASDKLVLAFRMPAGYVGTPTIGLITPVKARFINDLKLDLRVAARSYEKTPLIDPKVFPMFYPKTEIRAIRRVGDSTIVVEGTNLVQRVDNAAESWGQYFWNGYEAIAQGVASTLKDSWADRIVLKIFNYDPKELTSELRMQFSQDLGLPALRFSAGNPDLFSISKATVIKHAKWQEEDPKDKAKAKTPAKTPAKTQAKTPAKTEEPKLIPGAILAELEGNGFPESVTAEVTYYPGSDGPQTVAASLVGRGKVYLALNHYPKTAAFAVITLKAANNPMVSATAYIEIPPEKAEKPETDEISEITIKRVPIKKTEKKN
jgi:hypothetical protein